VWGREANGLILTFHLAGINNQNFIMRDEETGSYWQQISGLAIAGPLAGHALKLIHSDELTVALWKTEEPAGTLLADYAADASHYSPKNWDVRMKKTRTVLNYPEHGLANRDLMIGVQAFGDARAFLYEQVLSEKLVQDRVGAQPVILVVGPDGQSIRIFRDRIAGITAPPDFYRTPDAKNPTGPVMMDSATGSRWNFKGCAVEGKAAGTCLDPVDFVKDYWFDWRNYHPTTTVYREGR